MDVLSPAYIMLLGLLLLIFLVSRPVKNAVEKAKADLSDEDLKTFREQYFRASTRQDMPMKFNEYAKATDRAKKIWTLAMLAIVAALLWVILTGPGLGIFPSGSAE